MTSQIVLIVLFSAVLHPLWNMLIKRESDQRATYVAFTTAFALYALVHGLVTGADFMAARRLWPLILLSVAGQLLYGTMLISTLKRGDLSSYYPVIRAAPLFIVMVNVLVFSVQYQVIVLAGIAAVLLGSFLLQYRRGTRFFSDPLTLVFAVLAMIGSGVYSLADSRMMQHIEPSVMMFLVEILTVPVYIGFYLYNNRRAVTSNGVAVSLKRLWNPVCLVYAALAYVSYYLVLQAYALGGEVAMVTSLRQASIPISVLLGGLYLREGAIARRFIASLILALGIIIIMTA
jgi:drug/metabolite transporter (DMT)-like permease